MGDPKIGGAFDPNFNYTGTGTTTGETFTNAALNGTTTIAAGATITAPAIVGATITGTVTVAAGATLTSPTLVTPTLGVALATSINGNVLTTGSSTYTGTAGQTYTFPTTSATIARTDAANTFTGVQTMTSPALTTPSIAGATITGTVTVGAGATLTSPALVTPTIGVAAGTSLAVTGLLKSSSASAGVGYATGAGGTGTQGTNRTTTVVMSPNPCLSGAITLISAAGSTTPASFTVTDSAVAATDTVIVNQKSGTDIYEIFVTAVGAGSFQITSFTTGGTTTETPVFNFTVLKGVAA